MALGVFYYELWNHREVGLLTVVISRCTQKPLNERYHVVPLYLPLLSVHVRFVFRRGSLDDHVIEVGSPHVIGQLLHQFLLLFCALSCVFLSNYS